MTESITRWYVHVSQQAQFKAAIQIEKNNPELLQCLGLEKPEPMTHEVGILADDAGFPYETWREDADKY
jgi:hypothetical protein